MAVDKERIGFDYSCWHKLRDDDPSVIIGDELSLGYRRLEAGTRVVRLELPIRSRGVRRICLAESRACILLTIVLIMP